MASETFADGEVTKTNECPTGVLIEIELQDNTRNYHQHIAQKDHNSLCLHGSSMELVKASVTTPVSKLRTRSNDGHLNLFIQKEKVPNTNWRTPSPCSMKMIKDEASRIIDNLYRSPLEGSEICLCDEVFPYLDYDSDDCAESNKCETVPFTVLNRSSNELVVNNDMDHDAALPEKSDLITGTCPLIEKNKTSHSSTELKPLFSKDLISNKKSNVDLHSRSNLPASGEKSVKAKSVLLNAVVTTKDASNSTLIGGNVNENTRHSVSDHKSELKSPAPNADSNRRPSTEKTNIYSTQNCDLHLHDVSTNNAVAAPARTSRLTKGFGIRTPVLRKEQSSNIQIRSTEDMKNSVIRDCLNSRDQKIQNIPKQTFLKPSIKGTLADSVLAEKKLYRERELNKDELSKADVAFPKSNIQYRSLRNMKPLSKSTVGVDTPNSTRLVRRSNSFQVTNKEKENGSFVKPSPKISKPQMLPRCTNNKSVIATPIKSANTLNCSSSQSSSSLKTVKRTPFALNASFATSREVKYASKESSIKKPVSSVSSQRSKSRIGVASALTKTMNDSLARRLFSDGRTPVKK